MLMYEKYIPLPQPFAPSSAIARDVFQRSLGWVGCVPRTTLQIKSLSQPTRYLLTTFWSDRHRPLRFPDFFQHFSNPSLFQCLSLIHISEPTRLGMISYA